MMRGRKTSSKTPFTQGNSNTDRESAVHRNSRYRRRQAYFTIDTNTTRKMVYQSTAGLVMVCMTATSSISHSWNMSGSAQVGQNTRFSGVRMDQLRSAKAKGCTVDMVEAHVGFQPLRIFWKKM